MSVRRRALNILLDVSENGAFVNLSLKDGLEGLSGPERKWVSALIYTSLDHLALIDYYISRFANGRIQTKIRGILRLGISQILFMRTPTSAACDESVKLTKEIGKSALSAYVNAVLRSIGRAAENDDLPPLPDDPVENMHIRYGFPAFLIEEYIGLYGLDFTKEMLSFSAQGMTLRTQYPYTAKELEIYLNDKDIPYRRGALASDAFHLKKGMEIKNEKLFIEGKITVQSESAMLVCRAACVEHGRILDACAAPGGKTAYMASLSQYGNDITAWELYPHRTELMKNTLERLHTANVDIECRDASIFDARYENSMDSVLLDVPCSGLGLPDKPDIRYKVKDESIRSLCETQSAILECCCRYVKPGGVLVYSTCTISRRENEDQIDAFLKKHPEFRSASLASCLPEAEKRNGERGMIQLFPHIHGTEGFFIAKMEKCK